MNPLPISPDESPPVLLELIHSLKIRDAMTTELVTVTKDQLLRDAQRLMKESQVTGVPVVEGKRLVGIISVDDILKAWDGGRIGDAIGAHMTRNVIVLEDDMPLSFGISYMQKYRFGRFPVLSREKTIVGIVTSRDILVALLLALNREVEKIEGADRGTTHADHTGGRFRVRRFDFEQAGTATSEIRARLKERGIDSALVRRIGMACYELEMNQVVHSVGGTIEWKLEPEYVQVVAADFGPGIGDVDRALTEGYSTADEWIRSLGFGAGMGLPNARRVSDEFELSSSPSGTTVRARVYFNRTGGNDDG